ncbi:hypothetical protein ABK040_003427 [Willaertia magna]
MFQQIPSEVISIILSYLDISSFTKEETLNFIRSKYQFKSITWYNALTNLKYLNLSDLENNLNNLHLIGKSFPKLEYLLLNNYTKLTQDQLDHIIFNLPDLKRIGITNCFMINDFDFTKSQSLEMIDLSTNQLELRKSIIRRNNEPEMNCNAFQKPIKIHTTGGYILNMKSLTQNAFTIMVESYYTIEDLKYVVWGELNVKPDCQRMIFAGKRLCDDHMLSDYNIQKDSTIHIVFRLRGGKGLELKIEEELPQSDNQSCCILKEEEERNEQVLLEERNGEFKCLFEKIENDKNYKVYSMPMFENNFCNELLTHLVTEKKEGQDYKFSKEMEIRLKKYIELYIIPQINNKCKMSPVTKVSDMFIVNYHLEKDNDLILHTDNSTLTLNICLENDSVIGNEVEFLFTKDNIDYNPLLSLYNSKELNHNFISTVKQHVLEKDEHIVNEWLDINCYFERCQMKKGYALLHYGQHAHQTLPIRSGERFNLVCWLN